MRKILSKPCVLAITFLFYGVVASPTVAETWECTIDKAKRQNLLPTTITVSTNADTDSVVVKDDLLKSWGRNLVEAEMGTRNAKRQTISWSVEGIPVQRVKHYYNQAFTKVLFSLTKYKNNKMKMVATPSIQGYYYAHEQIGKGRCKVK